MASVWQDRNGYIYHGILVLKGYHLEKKNQFEYTVSAINFEIKNIIRTRCMFMHMDIEELSENYLTENDLNHYILIAILFNNTLY